MIKYSNYPTSSGIYRILNLSNNKSYVGSGVNLRRRAYEHFSALNNNKHYNIHLQRSYNLNRNSFIFEVLEECPIEKLIEKENEHINKLNSNNKNNGYNMENMLANSLGYRHSEESKIKIKIKRKLQVITPESRRKMVATVLSKNPNHFKDMGAKSIGRPRRESDKTVYRTEEFRERISKISKERARAAGKPFRCNETNQIFSTSGEAAEALGINYKSVWRVLNGQRRHTQGFTFAFI